MEEPERTSQIVESKLQASRWFKDLQWTLPTRLNGKVICVTGCTSGAGRLFAEFCAARGAQVLMLNRSSERADLALAGVRAVAKAHDKAEYNISLVPCDLQDFQSVRTAAAALRNQCNIGIDVLCNNAAHHNEPSIDGSAGADEGHGSHLGHFLLTAFPHATA